MCLAGESGDAIETLREGFGENFDGDFAIQLAVGRAIDLARPVLTELRCDAIVRDGRGRSHIAALVAWYHPGTGRMREQERMTRERKLAVPFGAVHDSRLITALSTGNQRPEWLVGHSYTGPRKAIEDKY